MAELSEKELSAINDCLKEEAKRRWKNWHQAFEKLASFNPLPSAK